MGPAAGTIERPSSFGPDRRAPVSHRPRRSLGQNFLVDPFLRRRIVEEARITEGEVVLEIGPGQGAITDGLAREVGEAGGRLILVELDDDLAAALLHRYADAPHVEVIHASILDIRLDDVAPPRSLKVVGNIPYNLTSPILFHLLARPRPREVLLMVQKEVADRILEPPGGKGYGALSVGVRAVAEVEPVLRIAPGAFRPRPKVDSAVIRIRPLEPPPLSPGEEDALRHLTRSLFQWRRKQLGRILRDHPDLRLPSPAIEALLQAAGVSATDRPESIPIDGWRSMARMVAEEGDRSSAQAVPGGRG